MPLVSTAYIGLLLLAAVTPVLLFFDNLIVAGAIQLYAAAGMMIVTLGMRSGEARHVFKLIRIPAMLAAVPLIWMLIQLLPIETGLSQSIWESAASSLGTPHLLASITVDPGLTLIAVFRLATMAAIAFVAAAVSIDRQRAEKLLLLLASAAAVISLVLLASRLGGLSPRNEPSSSDAYAAMTTASIVGIMLFAASIVMAIERFETRHKPRTSSSQTLLSIGIPIAGLLVCSSTLIAGDAGHAIFAAACGFTTMAIIYSARRLGLGPTAGLAMGCVAILAAAVIIWTKGAPTAGDLSLRYVSHVNDDVVTRDNRILEAVGMAGSGAGTFPLVSAIYGAQEPWNVRPATFAGQIAVELGRPALWVIAGLGCILIAIFARGAFSRGRDCFYALAGAGVTVVMVLDCFSDATLASSAVSVLVAVTLGLGFGQSVGRTP